MNTHAYKQRIFFFVLQTNQSAFIEIETRSMFSVEHVPKLNFETIQMNCDNSSPVVSLYLIVNKYSKSQQTMHLEKEKFAFLFKGIIK